MWGLGHFASLFKTIASGMGSSIPKQAIETLSAPTVLGLPFKKAVVRHVVCGKEAHACLTEEGHLLTWGSGSFGQLGHGGTNNQSTPKRVDALSKETIKHISFGSHHAAAITLTGEVYMWGKNTMQQLGLGESKKDRHYSRPQLLPYFREMDMSIIQVSCGGNHSAAIYDYWSDTLLKAGQGRLGADEVRRLQKYLVSQPWVSVQPLFDSLESTTSIQAMMLDEEGKASLWDRFWSSGAPNRVTDRVLIKLSTHLLTFEKARQRVMNVPLYDEFTIKNVGKIPADWSVIATQNPTYDLDFEPATGTIDRDQEVTVKVRLVFKLHTSIDVVVTVNVTGGQRHFLLLKAVGEAPGGEAWNVDFENVQILERIGRGISATIYKVLYKGKVAALKRWEMDPDMLLSCDLNDFIKEVSLVSALPEHKNLVRFIGACAKPASLCMVMELMERGSLFDLLKDPSNMFSLDRIFSMAIDAATGMAFLHAHDVIHRDMKSLNLLVNSEWTVKVADFGLSRVEAPEMTGGMGTTRWMSPEILNRCRYTKSSDVFSFGLTLNEMMTRKIPFHDLPNLEVSTVIVAGMRPEIPEYTPPDFADLIRKCWAQEPDKRPSFVQIVEELKMMQTKLRNKILTLGPGSSAHFIDEDETPRETEK